MHREGFTQVPNHVWDDVRLDCVDVALLAFLASHVRGYIVKGPTVRKRLKISEPKYNERMRKIVALGLLVKETAYLGGKVAGIYVWVAWPKLSKENVGSDSDDHDIAEPSKAVRSNCRSLRRTIPKNSAPPLKHDKYRQVIDDQDDMTEIEF